ncbi:hypothetical protein AMATHDRAFT_41517, partial [Amanita thiersii Skay4041]
IHSDTYNKNSIPPGNQRTCRGLDQTIRHTIVVTTAVEIDVCFFSLISVA